MLFNLKTFASVLVRGFIIATFFFYICYLALGWNDGMEEVWGSPIDKNVFQVALQTEVVLVMTLQMCFAIKNWTVINFSSKKRQRVF